MPSATQKDKTDEKVVVEESSLAETAVSAKELFLRKSRREETQKILLGDEEVEIKLRALPPKQLNDLLTEHPARQKGRGAEEDRGLAFNRSTFPPILASAVIYEPKMSAEEWAEIWNSPDWSAGELADLFDMVWAICNKGFNVPFGGRG